MKVRLFTLILFCARVVLAQSNTETYPVDPASEEQKGVPKGEILKFTFADSKIFPGTSREISIYIPAQYKADRPACVYVNQDGVQWNAPTVFDNLIAKGEMPVTIGVFITPGEYWLKAPMHWTGLTAASNTTAWEIAMHGSCWKKFSLLSSARRQRTAEPSIFPIKETTVPSAGKQWRGLRFYGRLGKTGRVLAGVQCHRYVYRFAGSRPV